MKSTTHSVPVSPWYRHGMVWMLLSGPALVIVASLVTAYIAISSPDPVLANDAYEFGQQTQGVERSHLPAQKARNHAATPAEAPIR
ncbi:MAG: FixH family protein [Alphaproteobacteria bacterium]|nr:FixH family protein [Alphaproteobacteria bacterium]